MATETQLEGGRAMAGGRGLRGACSGSALSGRSRFAPVQEVQYQKRGCWLAGGMNDDHLQLRFSSHGHTARDPTGPAAVTQEWSSLFDANRLKIVYYILF